MFLKSVRIVCVSVSSFLCVAAFSGCSSTTAPRESADYARSINRYFQGRPMCLWSEPASFPADSSTADQAQVRGYDALVSAGLLTRKQNRNSAAVYDLTATGRDAFDHDIQDRSTGNFCYGRRKVTGIAAAHADTRASELVDYQYTVSEAPAWARNAAVQAAFPQIAADLAGTHTAQATLLNTTDGWQMADRPLRPSEGQRGSALAKMKAVFTPGS